MTTCDRWALWFNKLRVLRIFTGKNDDCKVITGKCVSNTYGEWMSRTFPSQLLLLRGCYSAYFIDYSKLVMIINHSQGFRKCELKEMSNYLKENQTKTTYSQEKSDQEYLNRKTAEGKSDGKKLYQR